MASRILSPLRNGYLTVKEHLNITIYRRFTHQKAQSQHPHHVDVSQSLFADLTMVGILYKLDAFFLTNSLVAQSSDAFWIPIALYLALYDAWEVRAVLDAQFKTKGRSFFHEGIYLCLWMLMALMGTTILAETTIFNLESASSVCNTSAVDPSAANVYWPRSDALLFAAFKASHALIRVIIYADITYNGISAKARYAALPRFITYSVGSIPLIIAPILVSANIDLNVCVAMFVVSFVLQRVLWLSLRYGDPKGIYSRSSMVRINWPYMIRRLREWNVLQLGACILGLIAFNLGQNASLVAVERLQIAVMVTGYLLVASLDFLSYSTHPPDFKRHALALGGLVSVVWSEGFSVAGLGLLGLQVSLRYSLLSPVFDACTNSENEHLMWLLTISVLIAVISMLLQQFSHAEGRRKKRIWTIKFILASTMLIAPLVMITSVHVLENINIAFYILLNAALSVLVILIVHGLTGGFQTRVSKKRKLNFMAYSLAAVVALKWLARARARIEERKKLGEVAPLLPKTESKSTKSRPSILMRRRKRMPSKREEKDDDEDGALDMEEEEEDDEDNDDDLAPIPPLVHNLAQNVTETIPSPPDGLRRSVTEGANDPRGRLNRMRSAMNLRAARMIGRRAQSDHVQTKSVNSEGRHSHTGEHGASPKIDASSLPVLAEFSQTHQRENQAVVVGHGDTTSSNGIADDGQSSSVIVDPSSSDLQIVASNQAALDGSKDAFAHPLLNGTNGEESHKKITHSLAVTFSDPTTENADTEDDVSKSQEKSTPTGSRWNDWSSGTKDAVTQVFKKTLNQRFYEFPKLITNDDIFAEFKISWSDLFLDIIYVGAVFRIGDYLINALGVGDDPGTQVAQKGGVYLYGCLFLAVFACWWTKLDFTSKCGVSDMVHKIVDVLQGFFVFTMASSISSPQEMDGDLSNSLAFTIALFLFHFVQCLLWVELFATAGQRRVQANLAKRHIARCLLALIPVVASIISIALGGPWPLSSFLFCCSWLFPMLERLGRVIAYPWRPKWNSEVDEAKLELLAYVQHRVGDLLLLWLGEGVMQVIRSQNSSEATSAYSFVVFAFAFLNLAACRALIFNLGCFTHASLGKHSAAATGEYSEKQRQLINFGLWMIQLMRSLSGPSIVAMGIGLKKIVAITNDYNEDWFHCEVYIRKKGVGPLFCAGATITHFTLVCIYHIHRSTYFKGEFAWKRFLIGSTISLMFLIFPYIPCIAALTILMCTCVVWWISLTYHAYVDDFLRPTEEYHHHVTVGRPHLERAGSSFMEPNRKFSTPRLHAVPKELLVSAKSLVHQLQKVEATAPQDKTLENKSTRENILAELATLTEPLRRAARLSVSPEHAPFLSQTKPNVDLTLV